MFTVALLALLAWSGVADAHTAAFARGMYCLGGPNPNEDNPNTNTAVEPLFGFTRSQWWFQAHRGCDQAPPAPGVFLELPAGGSFTVELAHNRAQTTLSFDGQFTSQWPDGNEHPEDWRGPGNPPDCIQDDGAMHTNNQSMSAGTAFAISYNADLSAVTMENLVVFYCSSKYTMETCRNLCRPSRPPTLPRRRVYLCLAVDSKGMRRT